ncbi:MAG: IclR family transcriptional regulator domain-containing protein, partial [Actinomycetes bacterium]
VRALFPHPDAFVTRHGAGPRSLSALRRVLVKTRRQGYAVEDGEVTPGFVSLAMAVLDHTRHPIASVTVTAPRSDLRPDERVGVVREIDRTTRAIASRIAGHASRTSGTLAR